MVAARRIIPMVASVPNDLAQIYDRNLSMLDFARLWSWNTVWLDCWFLDLDSQRLWNTNIIRDLFFNPYKLYCCMQMYVIYALIPNKWKVVDFFQSKIAYCMIERLQVLLFWKIAYSFGTRK